MNEVISLILSLSLSGSIIALVLFILKPIIKNNLSKSIQYYIWIIVLLRLVMPFSFQVNLTDYVFIDNTTNINISSQNSTINSAETNLDNVRLTEKPNVNNYFLNLFNKYVLYLWIFGIIIAFLINSIGYLRFSKILKQTNMPASVEQNATLFALLKGQKSVSFFCNPYTTTPLLIGVLKPCIILPQKNISEEQLKNILLHEISHLRRFDILVKWFILIVTSIHWFNPLMYLIKKEIFAACELACDEAVIKKLNPVEKQAYGEALISVVAKQKYSIGALQATMCEEKRHLKTRLLAIMKYNKKSKLIIILSVVLIFAIIIGAIVLGPYGKSTFSKLEAIAECIKLEPEYPNNTIDIITRTIPSGGPPGSSIKVKYLTNIKQSSRNTYLITFTKEWGIRTEKDGAYIKSFYTYKVSKDKTSLIETDYNDGKARSLINAIK